MNTTIFTKFTLSILLLTFVVAEAFSVNTIMWPAGRYAITSDGNMHDPDDTGAIPMSIALMYYSGHKDKIVHLDHSNHLGESLASKYNDMKESIEGIKLHFGLHDSIVFDCQTHFEAAKANFVKEALKSTADNPLWFVCAGPMGTAFEYLDAVAKADHPKLQFIHCISHSNANNTHNDTPELEGKTWEAMKAYFPQVNYHDMSNQNKDTGFCSLLQYWSWMNEEAAPATWKWLYSRNRTASVHVGKFDMSDGGMTYWLLSGKVANGVFTGSETGNWNDVRAIFTDSLATGAGIVGTDPIPHKAYIPPSTEEPTEPTMPSGTLTPITPTDTDGVLLFQAEHSYSARGFWELLSPANPKYFPGASNDSMLIFTGNQPNLGPATSPLEYTFVAPESGTYQLIMRVSRILDGAANDECNDFYVRMAGDFQPGENTLPKSNLLNNTKHYFSNVPQRTWGWTSLSEIKVSGETVKKKLMYILKKDSVYTFTISGRSQRAIMDYILLFNTSKATTAQAQAAKPNYVAPAEGSLIINFNEAKGLVTRNPDKPIYDPGEEVIVTAEPKPGFIFKNWTGYISGEDNPLTVKMDSTIYLTANFDIAPLPEGSLIITVNPAHGSVTKSPDKPVYDSGEEVILTASPSTGWKFVGWSGDVSGIENPLTIKMDSTIYLTAIFESEGIPGQDNNVVFYDNFNQDPVNPIVSSGDPQVNYTVWTTVTLPEMGGGTAMVEDYLPGDGMIKLLARESTTQAGNRTEVSAPLADFRDPFNPVLSQNTDTLEWIFTAKQNRNSAGGTTGFNGTNTGLAVILASDAAMWDSQLGSNGKGYAITFLKPDAANYCISLSKFEGGLSNYTVIAGNKPEDIFSDRRNWVTVRVTYIPATSEWSLFFRDENSISTKGDVFNYAGLKHIESAIDTSFTDLEMTHYGFALNTPSPGAIGATGNAFFVDDFSVSLSKEIEQQYQLITEVAGTGGSITKSPDQSEYQSGIQVELTATPAEGYEFVNWTGDVTSTDNPLTVTITANTNITANFALKSYTLAITANNGTVDQSVTGTAFNHNTELLLTATPDEGYDFVNWTGDISSDDNPLTVTITSNLNITANFTPNTAVQENELRFEVFPNPSSGIFSVTVMQAIDYKVYSINGLLVKSGSASETFLLDLSGFNNAIYILQIESKEGVSVKRIMKISE
jgi:uncharacterized repeat protein (TIGR02543 family)